MKKWEKIEEWFRCLVIRGLRLIQQTRYKKTRSSVFCNYAIIIILYYIILLYYIICLRNKFCRPLVSSRFQEYYENLVYAIVDAASAKCDK